MVEIQDDMGQRGPGKKLLIVSLMQRIMFFCGFGFFIVFKLLYKKMLLYFLKLFQFFFDKLQNFKKSTRIVIFESLSKTVGKILIK